MKERVCISLLILIVGICLAFIVYAISRSRSLEFKVGDCLIYSNEIMKITEEGEYSFVTINQHGSLFIILKKSVRNSNKTDCYNIFDKVRAR